MSDPAKDPPIGSPAIGETCSPCFTPDCNDQVALLKKLSDQVCALNSQHSNWHALLEKSRNRISALEAALRRLGKPIEPRQSVAVNICDGGEVEVADALPVCKNGERSLLAMDECSFPVMGPDGLVARPYGPTWLDERFQFLNNVFTANQEKDFSSYDMPVCAKFAIIHLFTSVSSGSAGNGNVHVTVETPTGQDMTVIRSTGSDAANAMIFAPLQDGKIKYSVVSSGSIATRNVQGYLYGFM